MAGLSDFGVFARWARPASLRGGASAHAGIPRQRVRRRRRLEPATSTLLGRATFGDPTAGPFEIVRTVGPHWSVDVKADPNFDLAVQNIVFEPGGQSGWHSHPGPVFIQVVLGTMTFYEGDDPTCTPIVRTAGQGYLDRGDHPHIARNETDLHAATLVTYLAPAGAALRIDEPNPGNCPF